MALAAAGSLARRNGPPKLLAALTLQARTLRERARRSMAPYNSFRMSNPIVAKNWPPLDQVGNPITLTECRTLLHHLHLQEIERMREKRTFIMPSIQPGDLLEIRYELSRSQQTFAVFQGYCVDVRNRRLNSGFVVKNTYDDVGVEQLFPRYSPRLLDVRNVKQVPRHEKPDLRPRTRNYRYRWWYYHRAEFALGKNTLIQQIPQKPGIMSMEPKIRHVLSRLRKKYAMQRLEAGLPPYIYPGPYQVSRRRSREVTAERERRMQIYAWDDRRKRQAKVAARKAKSDWATYKINKEKKFTALSKLPAYHPLAPGNLPK
mmetsp:Transcript_35111/g.74417  ORF Transcript_35111/g.74417 Transcript_35111/m.74417 type:complete len:317 (-) Transcript_35111:38-988(-)